MPEKTVRFYCHYCKKTLAVKLTESFQEEFKKTADKWPYPLIYPHNGHHAIIHLDEDFVERGITLTKIMYKE